MFSNRLVKGGRILSATAASVISENIYFNGYILYTIYYVNKR
jgi:hypothetical protein